jgi:hypothetical protein
MYNVSVVAASTYIGFLVGEADVYMYNYAKNIVKMYNVSVVAASTYIGFLVGEADVYIYNYTKNIVKMYNVSVVAASTYIGFLVGEADVHLARDAQRRIRGLERVPSVKCLLRGAGGWIQRCSIGLAPVRYSLQLWRCS